MNGDNQPVAATVGQDCLELAQLVGAVDESVNVGGKLPRGGTRPFLFPPLVEVNATCDIPSLHHIAGSP
ncbi:hypothetical protein ACTWQF_15335 [Streptomyces sp. 8N114]|uniref:hypothetical protein n=1 Tax=Streptomyces sp. 8N114 TaxID=3457419 RepID=UPI003FD29913